MKERLYVSIGHIGGLALPEKWFWHVLSLRSAPEEHDVYSLTTPIRVRSSGALCACCAFSLHAAPDGAG
jgi:hypothetical protein